MKLSAIKPVTLHPLTIRALKKGHPWITADSFSKKFPKTFLLSSLDQNNQLTFIHDPSHPDVLARLWGITPRQYGPKNFEEDLKNRIFKAFEKRVSQNLQSERENFYLLFGEADQVPGLHVLKLKDNILIQIYAFCWRDYFIDLISFFNQALIQLFPNSPKYTYWMQNRNHGRDIFYQAFNAKGVSIKGEKKFIISEYQINYSIEFFKNYDFGIYTDMSAIRLKLKDYFKGSTLNLFAYTGAFSLFALAQNSSQVVSVDLSENYLLWLDQNLKLNPNLNSSNHKSICAPVDNTLIDLKKNGALFDCIICDPPSFSSDGKKSTSAIDQYPSRIQLMADLLPTGGVMILFLNTHNITMSKFEEKIKSTLSKIKNSQFEIEQKLVLSQDCPTTTSFPEGNYLKGLVLKKL
jgi:23S rRNA (cytosine1962-C5)-methyltransferase